MTEIRFPEPVRLRLDSVGERVVATSWEALECLRDQWPAWARGRTYRIACRVCRDALDGWQPPQKARREFVKAARRAGLVARRREAVKVKSERENRGQDGATTPCAGHL
jgi:hypothetical protein